MTVYELEILLHYYARPTDWRGPSYGNPLHQRTMRWFVNHDLLTMATKEDGPNWKITAKGEALVQHILDTPLPKMEVRWVRGDSR